MAKQSRQAYLAADTSVALVDTTIGGLLGRRAADFPDRDAIVGVGHDGHQVRLTYRELYDEARRVATALSAMTQPGDYVALWAPNVTEWPIVQYGAALAGVVLVALNPALRDAELQYALEHSRATILLHADAAQDHPMADIAERVAAGIGGLRRISLSERSVWRAAEIDDKVLADRAPRDPDAVVMLQYTSGTTGRPKGVVLRDRSLLNAAILTIEAVGAGHGARFCNPLPMFHTAGCGTSTLGPLWSAGTVFLINRFRPDTVLDTLIDERIEVLFYVPAVLSALVTAQRGRPGPAPPLRVVLGGAAAVAPELIAAAEAMFGATVFTLFGQTELAPVLSTTRPHDAHHHRLHTVGRPLPQVDCKIIDPSGRVVGTDTVGEICARGYQQFVEYLHDPSATDAALDAEGFVRTGDLGAIDEDGYLRVVGRLKELIIRGGENISPVEVEELLAENALIDEVVVLGLPDERLGEIVAAVMLTPSPDVELKSELCALLRSKTAPYKVPERWFVADELPRTPTGKVQRFALREAILRDELTEL